MTSSIPELTVNPGTPTLVQGSLDLGTPTDLYQLTITRSSSARIVLKDLTDNADLRVYKRVSGQNQLIGQPGTNSGTLSEVLLFNRSSDPELDNDLEPGTYIIEVSLAPNTGVGDYKLEVELNTETQRSNLWWRNPGAQAAGIWRMNGVENVGATVYGGVGAEWRVRGIADLDDDGEDDIIWRNTQTGEVGFWLLKNGLQARTGAYGAGLEWDLVAIDDFDGNNRVDLLWRNTVTNAIGFWLMDGTERRSANAREIPAGWLPVLTLDADGDTKADIFWRNTITGEAGLWLMDGMNPKQGGQAGYAVGLDWTVQGVGDFNNDGNEDIVWRQTGTNTIRGTGTLGFWLMNRTNITHAWAIGAPMDWNIAAIGDFDGAGADDILWSGPNREVGIWLLAEDGRNLLNAQVMTTLAPGTEIAGTGDFNGDGQTDLVYRNPTNATARVSLLTFNSDTNVVSERDFRDYTGVTGDWNLQGVLKREIENTPFEISGRTPVEWFDLGRLNDRGVYRDDVRAGMEDYFRFNVAVRTKLFVEPSSGVEFKLASLSPNQMLNLGALDPSQLDWQTPTPGMELQAGNWVVQVSTQNQRTTAYSLDIKGVPQITNIVGTSFSITGSALTLIPSVNQNSTSPNLVNVNFSVKNAGGFPITAFKVGFRISRNGEIETTPGIDDPLQVIPPGQGASPTQFLEIDLRSNALEAGQSRSFPVQLKLPDTIDPFWFVDGKYTIGMVLDPNNDIIEEGGENDNLNTGFGRDKAELLISGTETTELTTSLIRVTQGTLAPGQTVTIEYTVQNLGNKPTPRNVPVPVRFVLSNDPQIDRENDWIFTSEQFTEEELPASPTSSAIAGAVNGVPAVVTRTVTLTLPSLEEFGWREEVDGQSVLRSDPFYIGVIVNRTEATGINEPDFENNEPGDVTDKPDLLGRQFLSFRIA